MCLTKGDDARRCSTWDIAEVGRRSGVLATLRFYEEKGMTRVGLRRPRRSHPRRPRIENSDEPRQWARLRAALVNENDGDAARLKHALPASNDGLP